MMIGDGGGAGGAVTGDMCGDGLAGDIGGSFSSSSGLAITGSETEEETSDSDRTGIHCGPDRGWPGQCLRGSVGDHLCTEEGCPQMLLKPVVQTFHQETNSQQCPGTQACHLEDD